MENNLTLSLFQKEQRKKIYTKAKKAIITKAKSHCKKPLTNTVVSKQREEEEQGMS